jgi:EpsI family protein
MASSKIATGLAIALSVLVGGAAYALRAKQASPGDAPVTFDALPLSMGSYRGSEEWFDEGTYTVLRADTTTLRRYVDQSGTYMWFFAAYFGEQNYGQQIHSPRNCLPGGGWNILSLERVPVNLPGRGPIVANRLIIEADGNRQVMLYFFITRVGTVASEYRLKFELARAALTFQPRDAFFIRVTAPVGPDGVAAATDRALDLLSTGMPLLSRGLPF